MTLCLDSCRFDRLTRIRIFEERQGLGYEGGYELRLWREDPAAAHRFRNARIALSVRPAFSDKYGRTVAQCFLADGRDTTAAMIESGTATEYCRFSGNHYGTC